MRYAKVDRRLWADEKFSTLSDSAKLLFLYLLTTPYMSAIPGAFRATPEMLAAELGWSLELFRERYGELSGIGLVEADWRARLVHICNAIRYNFPDNSNVIKGWRTAWDELPECHLKHDIWAGFFTHIQLLEKSWLSTFTQACPEPYGEGYGKRSAKQYAKRYVKPSPNPMPIQEQEQEQEQKQEQEQEQEQKQPSLSSLVSETGMHQERFLPELKNPTSTIQDQAVRKAVQWVCQQLNFTGNAMKQMVRDTITSELRQSTDSVQGIAEMMVRCRLSYEAIPHPSFMHPPKQFFTQGIWKQSHIWKDHGNGSSKAEDRFRTNFTDIQGIIGSRESKKIGQSAPDHPGDVSSNADVKTG